MSTAFEIKVPKVKENLVLIDEKSAYKFNDVPLNLVMDDLNHLLGKVLTIIDASIVDIQQRKALKDLIRQDFFDSMIGRTEAQSKDKELTKEINESRDKVKSWIKNELGKA